VGCRARLFAILGDDSQFSPASTIAPAANTSAPPNTTWNVARKNVVTMYLFWTQTIAQRSMNTNHKGSNRHGP
jgi:hypothetical protein